jgi:hypothetical protein
MTQPLTCCVLELADVESESLMAAVGFDVQKGDSRQQIPHT